MPRNALSFSKRGWLRANVLRMVCGASGFAPCDSRASLGRVFLWTVSLWQAVAALLPRAGLSTGRSRWPVAARQRHVCPRAHDAFFSYELSRLGAGRFSFACIFASPFDGFFFRHGNPPFPEPSTLAVHEDIDIFMYEVVAFAAVKSPL